MATPPSMPQRQARSRAVTKRPQSLSSPSAHKGKGRARSASSPRRSGRLGLKRRVHVAVDGRRYFENMDGEMVFLDNDARAPPPYTSHSILSINDKTNDGSGSESETESDTDGLQVCKTADEIIEDSQQPEDLLVFPTHQVPTFEETQDPGMVADCEESYANANSGDEDIQVQENQAGAGPSGSGHSDNAVAAGSNDDGHLFSVAFLTDADLEKFSPRQNTEEIIHRMRMHAAWSSQMQVRMAELKAKLAEETSHSKMSHWDMNELKVKFAAAEETIARIAAAMGTQA